MSPPETLTCARIPTWADTSQIRRIQKAPPVYPVTVPLGTGYGDTEKRGMILTSPEVIARAASAAETPRNAANLAALATEQGWSVRTTYARGTLPGRTSRVVDSVAVRMSRQGWPAAAIWIDGKFWRALTPFRSLTLAEIKTYVRGPR